MTTETGRRPIAVETTLVLPFVDLSVGNQIGLFVDLLNLGPKVSVTLQHKPIPIVFGRDLAEDLAEDPVVDPDKDPSIDNLLVYGTPAQLSAFEHTLDYYQQATVDGMYDENLRVAVSNDTLLPIRRNAA
jgi:hypothetical protein